MRWRPLFLLQNPLYDVVLLLDASVNIYLYPRSGGKKVLQLGRFEYMHVFHRQFLGIYLSDILQMLTKG